MVSEIHDRYLWFGFGVCLFLAAHAARHAITDIVRLTEIDPDQYQSTKRPEQPEDTLSLDTLETLALSPTPNIANAAISLIIGRIPTLPNSYRMMAREAWSTDSGVAAPARRALTFLRDWPMSPDVDSPPLPYSPMRNTGDGSDAASTATIEPVEFRTYDPFGMDNDWTVTGEARETLDDSLSRSVDGANERTQDAVERETQLRRRRREAMVLHDGDGRIEEADIIRPRM